MYRWLRNMVRAAGDSRGIALVTALFVIFAIGMMLFTFVFINQNEVGFAAIYRNNTEALALAEAGVQEAVVRVNTIGGQPGSTVYTNSLAGATTPASQVWFEPSVASDPGLFPIRSTASFQGTKRTVRILERVISKTGLGRIIFGSQVSYQGDTSGITGDTYAIGPILLSQYVQTPQCAPGATATNLVSPQLFAGAGIAVTGSGANVVPPCGFPPVNVSPPTPYLFECSSHSTSEVAPTSCPRDNTGGGGYVEPVHWHPMTPIGMKWQDFTEVMNHLQPPDPLVTPYLTAVQATQTQSGPVTYTPQVGGYAPTYPQFLGNKVMLIVTIHPQNVVFCVDSVAHTITFPSPPTYPACVSGNRYGVLDSGTPRQTRYLDFGLVQDDLNRKVATKFFQPPDCAAPCPTPGLQNGIRYIPLPPLTAADIQARACVANVNPGHNVFDSFGGSCPPGSPVTTITGALSVTFDGVQSDPEGLVLNNAVGQAVQITGSKPGSDTLRCSNTDWTQYNWGLIISTGDITLMNKFVLTGFIFAGGTVTNNDTTIIRGSVSSAPSSVNGQNLLASTSFCPGNGTLLVSPTFNTFTTLTWVEVPQGQP